MAVGLEGGVVVAKAVVHVPERRTWSHFESFGLEACLFAQSREQPHANRDRYRYKAILVSDEYMNFLARIQRALHRYRADGEPWSALRARAMREDHSWTASAKRYVEMYAAASKARRAA